MTKQEPTLRIRCEVLKALATHGPCTSKDIQGHTKGLTAQQIQKALYRLLDQDRIFKVGQADRQGKEGRPLFLYDVRDEWEPKQSKRTGKKKGRQNYQQSLRHSNPSVFVVVKYRDRKIRLLQGLLDRVGGTDRDLIYGILADYGYQYTRAA